MYLFAIYLMDISWHNFKRETYFRYFIYVCKVLLIGFILMSKQVLYTNPVRHYRKLKSPYLDEQKIQVIVAETDVLITVPLYLFADNVNKGSGKKEIVDADEVVRLCYDFITYIRSDLQNYTLHDTRFEHSLQPIKAHKNASLLIKAMCEAGKYANVGPFAAVAGSVAQMTATMLYFWIEYKRQRMREEQANRKNIEPTNIIVENGGDIYMFSTKERIVGVLANINEGQSLGVKITPQSFPLSVCSSSSKIGHSLSFGQGDIAMVMAKNAALADAFATSYCNDLKSSKDIQIVLERARQNNTIKSSHHPFGKSGHVRNAYTEIFVFLEEYENGFHRSSVEHILDGSAFQQGKSGVLGVFVQCDETMGAWGDIELVVL